MSNNPNFVPFRGTKEPLVRGVKTATGRDVLLRYNYTSNMVQRCRKGVWIRANQKWTNLFNTTILIEGITL